MCLNDVLLVTEVEHDAETLELTGRRWRVEAKREDARHIALKQQMLTFYNHPSFVKIYTTHTDNTTNTPVLSTSLTAR
jgi:hypothetical protein